LINVKECSKEAVLPGGRIPPKGFLNCSYEFCVSRIALFLIPLLSGPTTFEQMRVFAFEQLKSFSV